jgi:hypothetical protein
MPTFLESARSISNMSVLPALAMENASTLGLAAAPGRGKVKATVSLSG